MIAFDSSFLIDYLDGEQSAADLLDRLDRPEYYAPTIVLYEIYEGAASYDSDSIETARRSFDWLQPLSFTHDAAVEAARVNAELRADGSPINAGDVLVAGVCRHYGASIVTRDSHFDLVDDLETISY